MKLKTVIKVEASYPGNLGAVEMMKFGQIASQTDKVLMNKLIYKKQWNKVWTLLKKVTGVKLKPLYEGKTVDDTVKYIQRFTASGSGRGATKKPPKDILDWLKKNTISKPLKLYRGMSLIRKRFDNKAISIINALNIGDIVPDMLNEPGPRPWTKKKSVAKSYATDGNLAIMIMAIVQPKDLIADLSQLPLDIAAFDDDRDYYKEDKEVIVSQPVKATIVYKKGRL